ncbi:uncharacterized protein JN550_002556 [Neoarthrinium moseri]|uniref:uncharacterized protein n=1 Tax=Neoarthrinium moseri TaxID=1658444 RepID=UPI001FDEA31E|nr:uncharacterized protein JN550_002556 [Neoarthrinium moseri]KAI1875127.1 hypothetical protein JN550_002556 [Neoarthrinium moseri]
MPASRRAVNYVFLALLLGSVALFLTRHARSREALSEAAGKLHEVGSKVIYYYSSPETAGQPEPEQDEHETTATPSISDKIPLPNLHSESPFKSTEIVPPEEGIPTQASGVTHDVLDESIYSSGLSELCRATKWTEGFWLHCHSQCGDDKTSFCGGLTNARNRIQTCLRLAIDAGASVIIPAVTARAEDDLLNTNDHAVCPDEWWDTEKLQVTLKTQCPHLKTQFCDTKLASATRLQPDYRHYLAGGHTNGTFRALAESTLKSNNIQQGNISAKKPVIIEFGDTYIAWDYARSEETASIRKDLFKTLKYNSTLLALGQEILKSPELKKENFIGVHLRGEGDWPAGFGSATDQMRRYVEAIEDIRGSTPDKVRSVYVSCGDRKAIQTFREMLEPLNYLVHDKWTLLASQSEKLATVESLGFDQKGIVEYEVLVNAKFWMGISMSSMSSLIAYARTADAKEDFFEKYIFPGSTLNGINRVYEDNMVIKGDEYTKLLVVSGVDIMGSFP